MRVWQTIRAPIIGRHVHKYAYAALVLSGRYEEAGDSGRHRVQAGDVVLHQAFEAHLDRVPKAGAVVLNVPLPGQFAFRSGVGKVNEPDAIVRLLEMGDSETAARLLLTAEIREKEVTPSQRLLGADPLACSPQRSTLNGCPNFWQ